jgi:AraC-like DNA-binding protein
MPVNLISYLYFGNILLGTILFFDVLIAFRKPLTLNILLLLIISGIIIHNFANFFSWSVYINVISRVTVMVAAINFLYYLYNNSLNKKIILMSSGLCLLATFNLVTINTNETHFTIPTALKLASRILFTVLFIYLSGIVYLKLLKSLRNDNIYSYRIKKWIRILLVMFIVGIINSALYQFYFTTNSIIIKIISGFIHLASCVLLMYRPQFINRTELSISLGKAFLKNKLEEIEEGKFILEFYTNQYYKKKETSIEEFATILKTNKSILNEYVYEKTKLNFTDLINKQRVDLFTSLVSNQDYKGYTLEGLAEMAGFGSRQSLYRHFKRFHGGNPSDLIRLHEKS